MPSTKQKNKYEGVYEEQDIHPCFDCGKPVKKRIDPDSKGYKVRCHICRQTVRSIAARTDTDKSNGSIRCLAASMLHNHGSGEVKIYRPGDPDFEEIAAQCSLKPKKTLPYYDAFEDQNYFK